ncbi:hypothetical protein HY489_01705 [Candidatus Woesearchaeota archaeon]|nr:hypothetical protein [Candidatus Woesearchaeota archaeon]
MQKKVHRNWLQIAGYALAILAAAYIAYSVWYYLSTAEKVEEFEVCYVDKCIKTFHAHADITIDLCGKKMSLPLEHGPLEGPHTHKERNLMHFHERLPYEPTTGKLLEDRPLRLETFMKEFKIPFNETCIANYCNGNACPDGKEGVVRMMVNQDQTFAYQKYVWKDGDEIIITFS